MSFIKELFARFSLHEGQSKSAELAYFFLLSLFPLMIFMLTLTAYLPISAEDVLGAVDQYAPDSAMSMVKSITEQTLNKRSGGLLSFGIIAVIWSASNGMNAIVRAFNHAYEVEENRSFIIIRLTSIFLTIAMVVTILIALLLLSVRQRNRNAGRRFHRRLGPVFAGVVGCPLGYQSAYPVNRVYRALHFRAE
ncbi:YihY family inner membrane protein [Bacillus velezensis]